MHVEEWHHYEMEHHRVEALIRVELMKAGEKDQPKPYGGPDKLTVEKISKQFRARGRTLEALSEVNLSVKEGEFICLIGPSGCGKSTLLNLIAGLDHPSKGRILAGGKPIRGAGPDRILMFQEPALFPWLTIQENVEFGLKIRGLSKADRVERAQAGLRLVGLADFARSYVHQLSGGMKQRAALARALVLDPELLLLDEPFAALDACSRDLLHQELLNIWERTAKTILFVTHNVPEALRLADRIVVFSARPGRVIREFRVGMTRPRKAEGGMLCEIGEAIHRELRTAASAATGGGTDAERP